MGLHYIHGLSAGASENEAEQSCDLPRGASSGGPAIVTECLSSVVNSTGILVRNSGESCTFLELAGRAIAAYFEWSPWEHKTVEGALSAVSREPLYSSQLLTFKNALHKFMRPEDVEKDPTKQFTQLAGEVFLGVYLTIDAMRQSPWVIGASANLRSRVVRLDRIMAAAGLDYAERCTPTPPDGASIPMHKMHYFNGVFGIDGMRDCANWQIIKTLKIIKKKYSI